MTRDSVLRWYPPEWRRRYGDELLALLDDTYGDAKIPAAEHRALVVRGAVERWRVFAASSPTLATEDRIRAGSLLVGVGWAFFIVAGCIFAKFAEGWRVATKGSDAIVPSVGYALVVLAAVVATAVIACVGAALTPSFVRLVRGGSWSRVRGAIVASATICTLAALSVAVTALWSRHLTSAGRNGGSTAYSVSFVIMSVLIAVAIIVISVNAAFLVRQLSLTVTQVRGLDVSARIVCGAMTLMVLGTVTWWCSVAVLVPSVMNNGIGNGVLYSSAMAPLSLIVMAIIMFVGGALALRGVAMVSSSHRIARGSDAGAS